MLDASPIDLLVLQEFQLRSADTDGSVARIVASSAHGREDAVPLLTSIDGSQMVATVRAFHEGESTAPDEEERAELEPFVSEWQSPRHYWPRIRERSQSPPTRYRLAVTESGINDAASDLGSLPGITGEDISTPIGLLWIGAPVGTHAGLLILLGNHADPGSSERGEWPLPLSRQLGVRIYDSRS